jgi:hypothetical protein
MWRDPHLSDTPFVINSEHGDDGASVRVTASGPLLRPAEMSDLIAAVGRALSDPQVQAIEVDVSGLEEAGPGLSGVLSLIRDLAACEGATLTVNFDRRGLLETG